MLALLDSSSASASAPAECSTGLLDELAPDLRALSAEVPRPLWLEVDAKRFHLVAQLPGGSGSDPATDWVVQCTAPSGLLPLGVHPLLSDLARGFDVEDRIEAFARKEREGPFAAGLPWPENLRLHVELEGGDAPDCPGIHPDGSGTLLIQGPTGMPREAVGHELGHLLVLAVRFDEVPSTTKLGPGWLGPLEEGFGDDLAAWGERGSDHVRVPPKAVKCKATARADVYPPRDLLSPQYPRMSLVPDLSTRPDPHSAGSVIASPVFRTMEHGMEPGSVVPQEGPLESTLEAFVAPPRGDVAVLTGVRDRAVGREAARGGDGAFVARVFCDAEIGDCPVVPPGKLSVTPERVAVPVFVEGAAPQTLVNLKDQSDVPIVVSATTGPVDHDLWTGIRLGPGRGVARDLGTRLLDGLGPGPFDIVVRFDATEEANPSNALSPVTVEVSGCVAEDATLVPDRPVTIGFATDSFEIVRRENEAGIDLLARSLRDPDVDRILIEGHADERGTEAYNETLSCRRAMSVYRLLDETGSLAGVEPPTCVPASSPPSDRFGVSWKGERDPVDPGHDEAAWEIDRRAVVTVVRSVADDQACRDLVGTQAPSRP